MKGNQICKMDEEKKSDRKEERASKSMQPVFNRKPISRRVFLKGTMAGLCFSMFHPLSSTKEASAKSVSSLFWVRNIPGQPFYGGGKGNYHIGVDQLLQLMGQHGLKFYRSSVETELSGPVGLIEPDDVVLIKVNGQWKYRGCTNSDLIRGLIQRILDHPEGFEGEVVMFENGQGRGSLNCDTTGGGYPDADVHANANDENHSFLYLVNTVFTDPRVSSYLLDPIRTKFIEASDHATDGYRTFENVSYPCFTTTGNHRVEFMEGIWNGQGYTQNLKLINVPVLKHHDVGGSEITASLKHFYGIVSMADGQSTPRHYGKLGNTSGKMAVSVRTPVLNIIDAIWVSHSSLAGYPADTTSRANQVLASQDPVALDYWAAKHIMYPISHSPRHLPTFSGIDLWLTNAQAVINDRGGLYDPSSGILVDRVTKNESEMTVFSTSSITLLAPKGGEIIPSGSEYSITWEAVPAAVKFTLMYSLDLGTTWTLIAKNLPETTYKWPVPKPLGNRKRCLVRVIGLDSNGRKVGVDKSDAPFTIEVIKVTSPNGGESFPSGSTQSITWTTSVTRRAVTEVRIYHTKDGEKTWNLVEIIGGDPGSCPAWTVPTVARMKQRCKVKVVLKDGRGNTVGSDSSDDYFTIQPLSHP